jgi:WS/DGAT/MGAT family acyltransferase
MTRLSGLDASFLYSETPAVHMHTLKVAVIDAPSRSDQETFTRFKWEMEQRLHLLPMFRKRLLEVPLGLAHPRWVEDTDFDIDRHLHRVRVAAPGGHLEMDRAIADIASMPLDRSRPLWEIWMLEGLTGGRLGFVAKVHHAVADGLASVGMLTNVMSVAPDDDSHLPAAPWNPERPPSRWRLAREAISSYPRRAARLPALVGRTARGLRSVLGRYRGAGVRPPRPFDTPRTPFNGAITPLRSFASTSMSLADVKAIKNELGVTVNDVILAIVAGGLRRYLDQRGVALDRSLVATVPVSVGGTSARSDRLGGNELSNMFTSLCTDIDDPAARIRAIHEVTEAAKQTHRELGADVLLEWTEYVPALPFKLGVRLYSGLDLADRHRSPANVIVSNVRGPSRPQYLAGARLRNIYSVGPVLEGLGLNLTAWSYGGQLSFAVLGDRRAVPDADRVARCLHASLGELLELVPSGRQAAAVIPFEAAATSA